MIDRAICRPRWRPSPYREPFRAKLYALDQVIGVPYAVFRLIAYMENLRAG